jgi:hypothetical protein
LPVGIRDPVVAAGRRVLAKPLVRPEIDADVRERLHELVAPVVDRCAT